MFSELSIHLGWVRWMRAWERNWGLGFFNSRWILIEPVRKLGAWRGFGFGSWIDMRRRAPDFRRPARRRLSDWIWWFLCIFTIAALVLFLFQHQQQDRFDRAIQVPITKSLSFFFFYWIKVESLMLWSGFLVVFFFDFKSIEFVDLDLIIVWIQERKELIGSELGCGFQW